MNIKITDLKKSAHKFGDNLKFISRRITKKIKISKNKILEKLRKSRSYNLLKKLPSKVLVRLKEIKFNKDRRDLIVLIILITILILFTFFAFNTGSKTNRNNPINNIINLILNNKSSAPVSYPTSFIHSSSSKNNVNSSSVSSIVIGSKTTSSSSSTSSVSPTSSSSKSSNKYLLWYTNIGVLNLNQTNSEVTGVIHNFISNKSGEIKAKISNTSSSNYNLTGQLSGDISGSINLNFSSNTFDGQINLSGTPIRLCGALNNVSFPSNCGFNGNWNVNIQTVCSNSSMNLVRKNNTITGTFCNGSLTGDITYFRNTEAITGNWKSTKEKLIGGFVFYNISNDYIFNQFNGSFGTNGWCGWRDNSTVPSQCNR